MTLSFDKNIKAKVRSFQLPIEDTIHLKNTISKLKRFTGASLPVLYGLKPDQGC